MEAHVEVTSLMFDCNTFKDKRHLLILVAITLPSKELQFCHFIMQINSKQGSTSLEEIAYLYYF